MRLEKVKGKKRKEKGRKVSPYRPVANISLSKIDNVFINQGPGKYTSIRSAISIAKALKISRNVNIYGYYSTQINNNNYDTLMKLLEEGRLTKNFIQPKYLN